MSEIIDPAVHETASRGMSRTTTPFHTGSTYLAPTDPFPHELAGIELPVLLALHSRVCRQLDKEYTSAPSGAHPVTLDRAEELSAELDERQKYVSDFD